MIRKALLLKIFSAAYMQRWNDKIRPIELIELDKQAHKMELMEKEVYGLVPQEWHPEIKMCTEDEFDSLVTRSGKREKVTSKDINDRYNEDAFNPKDGELVKAADGLAGFIEASVAILNGSASPELQEARLSLKKTV